MEHSLIVRHKDKIVFTSDAHWLHPLFELDDFLKNEHLPVNELFLQDKIAGKAAACMMAHLGIQQCHIELISERAIPIFQKEGIHFSYDKKVPQIECRTEDLITDDMSIEDTWLFLRKRAGRVSGLSLTVENLNVSVENKTILENLNIAMTAGEQLVIHGSNGAGKTTLLKTILGLVKPQSGSVMVGDCRVGSAEWLKNRMNTAYVHQENIKNTFPISAGEVVSIGLAASKMSASEIAYNVEIAMRRTGCFNLLKHSYHTLSGGEKQRVSLARCLCQHAKVLLLDEPTSFLDNEGKEDLLALLGELCRDEMPTILMVSHDLAWIDRLSWNKKELKGGSIC